MNKNYEMYTNINMRNTFYSGVGIGILANTMLLLFHVAMFVCGHRPRPRPADLPIRLLALVHLVMTVITGIISTDIFVSQGGWDDITCRSLLYLYRSLRGLSLCVTCLLSILQAITLSPKSSLLAKLKNISPKYNLCYFFFLCAFYTSIGGHLFVSIIATRNLTSANLVYVTESCSFVLMSYSMQHTFSILLTFREAFLIGVMALSTVYMATVLCRHKKQSKHLHSTSFSPKASPEIRATWAILVLMSFFVVMSTLDGIISYKRTMMKDYPIFYCIKLLVAHSYAAVSPLVFISIDKGIINFLRHMCGRKANI
uniref:vomeronasal type-1 receptor 52-like n=1 Tax=Jaculus jaculus TaxID=51337 RepID=UPI001E1B0BAB|nr:vomeronasal type-1 receptor 52-like [Jaculus jaculus]